MFPQGYTTSAVVVGGGITGLLTARRLEAAGVNVTVVEKGPRLGGQLHTIDLDGLPVDVGAESVHLGLPAMKSLVDELGLDDSVEGSRPGTSWLWTKHGRRPLPAGVGPAGPTRIRPVLESRVLGPVGLVRAGLEPLAARLRGPVDLSPGHDISVGTFTAGRFGRAAADAFVDPLLGSLHSGNIDELSLRATTPSLVPAASEGRSMLAKRPARPKSAPDAKPPIMFANWPGGLVTLTDAVIAGTSVGTRLNTQVVALRRLDSRAPESVDTGGPARPRYAVDLDGGESLEADAVVLAVPAVVAANLIAADAPTAAVQLRHTRVARTATIVLGFNPGEVAGLPALEGNGFLVPSPFGSLLKAGTHLSRKWRHMDGGHNMWRLSAGRAGSDLLDSLDNDELLDHVRRDLRMFTGIEAAPRFAHIHRWTTGLPQLTVGHPDRIATVRADLADNLPGVEIAGASYDGIGVGACVASANKTATRVLDTLGG